MPWLISRRTSLSIAEAVAAIDRVVPNGAGVRACGSSSAPIRAVVDLRPVDDSVHPWGPPICMRIQGILICF